MKLAEGDKEVLLAQWQTCVEMANSVSERRDSVNNLFVTLNLAIIAAISFIWDVQTIALLGSGIVVCTIWLFFINNYRELNKTKFDVINDIEKLLPVKPYTNEWKGLKKGRKYIESTKLERCFPVAFAVFYVGIFCFIVFSSKQGG